MVMIVKVNLIDEKLKNSGNYTELCDWYEWFDCTNWVLFQPEIYELHDMCLYNGLVY